jgi:2-phospho-L-lactate/phosphoenolpyruvate guanylyltransferase
MKRTFAIIPVSRFTHAKTRLSPTLTPLERANLLKSMLKDVIGVLKPNVEGVVVISSDEEVLKYVKELDVTPVKEEGVTDLNGALMQAIEWCSKHADQVLIVPSDVPLIKSEYVEEIVEMGNVAEIVIAPAKGGGTNALLCPVKGVEMLFGDCSFFEHIKMAESKDWTVHVYDSFYMALDVNTAEDLGEIMLHGTGTVTNEFLRNQGLKAVPNHGKERLHIKREE